MLRTRDIVALVLALILARMAWNTNTTTESLTASATLAFYLPRDKATVLSPMDVDGDGTNEALAVVQHSPQQSAWLLQILDLKPLHTTSKKTHAAPFRPSVLFTSIEMKEEPSAFPINLVTGQVLIEKQQHQDQDQASLSKEQKEQPTAPKDNEEKEINDRNRQYFCGTDWHDASANCGTPCPGGQASECAQDERCFADTSCDIHEHRSRSNKESKQAMFQLTPGGGLPSLVTLWSNGAMTLHSLTKDKSLGPVLEDTTSKQQGRRQASNNEELLALHQMWHIQLLPNTTLTHPDNLLWVESNVLFLDAYESQEVAVDHGMVVVSGSYIDEGKQDGSGEPYSFTVAVDAMKGTVVWDSFFAEETRGEAMPLPMARGGTSYARRRSRIAGLLSVGHTTAALPNCQVTLKQDHLKQLMPYSYWGPKDASLMAMHLDQKKKPRSQNNNNLHHDAKPQDAKQQQQQQQQQGGQHPKREWRHRFHKSKQPSVVFGRPNVLVTQTRGGLQVRSLKNGMALCHLSLLEETLYSDLNNDGKLDQVQVLLESRKMDPKDTWVWNLVAQLEEDRQEMKAKGAKKKLLNSNNHNLCHAMALSGLPAKEELFSASLCGSTHERVGDHPAVSLDSVPPIVVESLSGRRNTRDVIVALNNGMVHRLHGGSGRREWSTAGKHHENFPTWEEGSQNSILTRLQSQNVAPSMRPVLLAGENSLAVLSVKTGGVLASVPFPQTSTFRPVLAEVSGDGTTDVMILSSDGIWGFQIQVRPGSPIMLRIAVGLLIMGLMLAVLRNRFGQRTDKRATDE
jgi:hypothetical protein